MISTEWIADDKKHYFRDIIIVIIQQMILMKADDYIFSIKPAVHYLDPFQEYILVFIITAIIWYFVSPRNLRGKVFNLNGQIIMPFVILMIIELISCYNPTANYSYHNGRWLYYPEYQLFMFFMAFLVIELNISRKIWRTGMVIGYLIFIGTVFTDVFRPMTFSILTYRAAGLGLNPNISAEIIIMYLIMILDWSSPSLYDGLFLLVGGVAEFATLSREGLLIYLFLLIVYIYFHRKQVNKLFYTFVPVLVVLIVGVLFAPSLLHHTTMFSINSNRLSAFLGKNTSYLASGNGRITFAILAFHLALDKPFFGYGLGYVSTLVDQPHNEYLAYFLEQGLVGLGVFIWWLWELLKINFLRRNRVGLLMTLSIVIYGVFSHNIMEQKSLVEMVILATLFPFMQPQGEKQAEVKA